MLEDSLKLGDRVGILGTGVSPEFVRDGVAGTPNVCEPREHEHMQVTEPATEVNRALPLTPARGPPQPMESCGRLKYARHAPNPSWRTNVHPSIPLQTRRDSFEDRPPPAPLVERCFRRAEASLARHRLPVDSDGNGRSVNGDGSGSVGSRPACERTLLPGRSDARDIERMSKKRAQLLALNHADISEAEPRGVARPALPDEIRSIPPTFAGQSHFVQTLQDALVSNGWDGSRKVLSVVFPAYNEAERIADTIRAYATALEGLSHEIVVELDGCHDGTAEQVRGVQRGFPSVQIVEFPERLGKGRGVFEGIRRAKGEWIAYLDADGSVSPRDFLPVAATALSDGWDAVIASRYWNRHRIIESYGFPRWVASRTFNQLVRMLYGLPFEDTQCGAKIFRRSAIEAVIDDMKLSGYAFDVELLWRLWQSGHRIREVPVMWHHKDGSKVRLSRVARHMFIDILRLRVNP